jgi:hypothetical protein
MAVSVPFPLQAPIRVASVVTQETQLTSKEDIHAYIVKRAVESNIDPNKAIYIAENESQLDPKAVGDTTITCKRTGEAVYARGVFQLTRCYYPQISDKTAFDAKKNIDYVFDNGLLARGVCESQFTTCRKYMQNL